jgi:hypothetical protein
MAAIYQYFLAPGTISKATLIGSASNNIENWPLQSDQPNQALPWWEPNRGSLSRPKLARFSELADLSVRADGFWSWNWNYIFWTQGQMVYLLTQFFNGPNDYSKPSVAVTVQTWLDNGYVAYNAILARPVWDQDYKAQDGGFSDVILRFSGGTIIT